MRVNLLFVAAGMYILRHRSDEDDYADPADAISDQRLSINQIQSGTNNMEGIASRLMSLSLPSLFAITQ